MSKEAEGSQERRLTVRLSRELHRRLRLRAVREDTTLNALVTRWLEEKLGEGDAEERQGE